MLYNAVLIKPIIAWFISTYSFNAINTNNIRSVLSAIYIIKICGHLAFAYVRSTVLNMLFVCLILLSFWRWNVGLRSVLSDISCLVFVSQPWPGLKLHKLPDCQNQINARHFHNTRTCTSCKSQVPRKAVYLNPICHSCYPLIISTSLIVPIIGTSVLECLLSEQYRYAIGDSFRSSSCDLQATSRV